MELLARGWGRGLSAVWVYHSRRFAGGKGKEDGEKGNMRGGLNVVARRGERETERNGGGD